MDPDEVYRLMMAAKDALAGMVERVDLSDETFVETLVGEAEALTEHLDNLDVWLRRGGFKPRVWAGDAPDVLVTEVPPGGRVCGACGVPTDSEPCSEHQPGRAGVDGRG